MRRLSAYVLIAVIFTFVGLGLAQTEVGRDLKRDAQAGAREATRSALSVVAGGLDIDMRERVILENPEILGAIERGGGFGGQHDPDVARNMFGRDVEKARVAAIEKTQIERLAPRTWLIRMPIVNAVLFETDEGLVLVDTGMAPAGPAILNSIKAVSDAPLHTVIYTHGHVDHAYGTWALVENGATPEIVAHEALPDRVRRYMRLRGSIGRYMSQPVEQLPADEDDFVWPTRTFRDRLELTIGGEVFELVHHRGETDDQLYVWVPGRKAIATADYYQGFLPNAGNGKRVQRYVEEWAVALREMAALEPELLLPAHGAAIEGTREIQEALGVHAEALEYIVAHTLRGLNAGLRQDQVFESLVLPEHLASHPLLNVQYVTPKDISKMVIKQYVGWWDDLPSRWTPAPLEVEARKLVALAGGIEPFVSEARSLIEHDVKLACHLADWAWLAEPENPMVLALVMEVYRARILDPASNVQEILAYIDAMTAARSAQLAAEKG
jgi:alkyl sulfatase BDS1-like metallo-beta-lactamase superfamily hydrolase